MWSGQVQLGIYYSLKEQQEVDLLRIYNGGRNTWWVPAGHITGYSEGTTAELIPHWHPHPQIQYLVDRVGNIEKDAKRLKEQEYPDVDLNPEVHNSLQKAIDLLQKANEELNKARLLSHPNAKLIYQQKEETKS